MTSAPLHAALPQPDPDARALSARLQAAIRDDIAKAGGWIGFARYMELALYAPGLGYYSAGSRKLGVAGDFVTAPELSPLFGRTLARQVAPLVGDGLDLLELGAGSGALAVSLLAELTALGRLPRQYGILEVSADLRQRQQARIAAEVPQLASRVQWLEHLPERMSAVVIGNEVLDALPVHRIRVVDGAVQEMGVAINADGQFAWACRPAFPALAAAAAHRLPEGYETEIGLAAQALVADLGRRLDRGLLLFADYGFPAHEFFHPQRDRGTLMCHYRHHAHGDPFLWPGLQDITAHVDFSAVARAAPQLELLGYASQAQFLINCGITGLLAAVPAADVARYAPLAAQAQTLLSPAEMGELFKIIALGRGIAGPLQGFIRGDRSHTL